MGDPAASTGGRSNTHASFGRPGVSSPSKHPLRPDGFGQSIAATANGNAHMFAHPLAFDRHGKDRPNALPILSTSISDPTTFGQEGPRAPAIVIRRLSRNIGSEALGSMLIFAGDLIDTEFIPSPYQDDQGFATAVARFKSQAGALEAQQKLHGKPNTSKDANMIVEIHSGSMVGAFERRSTIDGTAPRTQSSSASSNGSSFGAPTARSRYGSSFQPNGQVSPPLPTPGSSAGDFPIPETSAHFQNLFSPQSPLANGFDDRHRVSGKSMINDDSVDDETGELLKDPVAYAKSGQHPPARRPTYPQVPVSRFGNLSLSTASGAPGPPGHSPHSSGFPSPRHAGSMQSAPSSSSLSPASYPSMGPNGAYGAGHARPQYPPVNPADQNPPCNTLYVGNLPIDTSEDELKAVFSKQRGYKRLCFRTKQNGPMCFVEFEDVSFATKALNDLYGHPLHNSVKGGIRLSFSKNPLGVRSGQASGLGPAALPPMTPQALAPGYAAVMAGAGFSSVSGPPPGLVGPAGMINGAAAYRVAPAPGLDGMFAHQFGLAASPPPQLQQQPPLSPPPPPGPVPSHDFAHQTSPRATHALQAAAMPPHLAGAFVPAPNGNYPPSHAGSYHLVQH